MPRPVDPQLRPHTTQTPLRSEAPPYRATRLPTGSRTGLDPIADELRATITSRFLAA